MIHPTVSRGELALRVGLDPLHDHAASPAGEPKTVDTLPTSRRALLWNCFQSDASAPMPACQSSESRLRTVTALKPPVMNGSCEFGALDATPWR